ncbi:ell-associated factor Eaf [Phymastichus coffea]|uniref:ell-associated factor Eaf n=1 Tax=Phymastichus coffea TaxID=108790 RepID=UPI00273C7625|nr:ell-associated factor Eaf [Phymastichus coffea]XP_058800243.1 ell-associated factor Eaf [Phymastichus coffea]XP_058800244.1 ell-associated factor Eaf [Phymastichus coffea]XP_058800245.1 ell-associated factor Eaf [Phymastichus coffea]XP_058800247.1 ell-associated factor Eaf [Phymastichus coffea]XP_058800248.1 ell-associated factor Eaf [Phymastichus coffea]
MKSVSRQPQHHHYQHQKQQQHQAQQHLESTANGLARSMAEKLGIGFGPRELKLGTTFTGDRSTAFHTLKYDFKPASVDTTKMATLDVGESNTMTVTVPHLDGAGTTHTVFKGSQRPYHKECVLIIDRVTGEVTLEKLSANIQVKKTRSETKPPSTLAVPSSLRPITPIEPGKSPSNGRTKSRTKVTSGKKREPSHQLRPKINPQRASYHTKSSPSTITPPNYNSMSTSATHTSTQPLLASLPLITGRDDYMTTSTAATSTISKPPHSSAPPRTQSPASLRTVSPAPPKTVSPPVSEKPTVKVSTLDNEVGILSDSSSSSDSSDSSDSDSEPESKPQSMRINGCVANGTKTSPPLSMPDNLLCEDLQLSESGSDSD